MTTLLHKIKIKSDYCSILFSWYCEKLVKSIDRVTVYTPDNEIIAYNFKVFSSTIEFTGNLFSGQLKKFKIFNLGQNRQLTHYDQFIN